MPSLSCLKHSRPINIIKKLSSPTWNPGVAIHGADPLALTLNVSFALRSKSLACLIAALPNENSRGNNLWGRSPALTLNTHYCYRKCGEMQDLRHTHSKEPFSEFLSMGNKSMPSIWAKRIIRSILQYRWPLNAVGLFARGIMMATRAECGCLLVAGNK